MHSCTLLEWGQKEGRGGGLIVVCQKLSQTYLFFVVLQRCYRLLRTLRSSVLTVSYLFRHTDGAVGRSLQESLGHPC